jgi:hypothetical protein
MNKATVVVIIICLFIVVLCANLLYLKEPPRPVPRRSYTESPLDDTQTQPSTTATVFSEKYVVFSANSVRRYAFYLPLTSLVWKQRFNFTVIVFLIGTEKEWSSDPVLAVVLKYLKLFDTKHIIFIPPFPLHLPIEV